MSTMNNRPDLSKLLHTICENCYYQPPETLQLKYPCIIYERSSINNVHASDDVYLQGTSYQVIVVDKNPDSEIVDKVSRIPTARHTRHYVSDKLNHDVFTIFYK